MVPEKGTPIVKILRPAGCLDKIKGISIAVFKWGLWAVIWTGFGYFLSIL
jgi:hypothetical protein